MRQTPLDKAAKAFCRANGWNIAQFERWQRGLSLRPSELRAKILFHFMSFVAFGLVAHLYDCPGGSSTIRFNGEVASPVNKEAS